MGNPIKRPSDHCYLIDPRRPSAPVGVKDGRAGNVRMSSGNESLPHQFMGHGNTQAEECLMGRGILLWLLGVPIPIIILLALFYH